MAKKVRYLRLPHAMVGANRVRKNDYLPSRGSLETVVLTKIITPDEWHRLFLFARLLLRRTREAARDLACGSEVILGIFQMCKRLFAQIFAHFRCVSQNL